MDALGISQGRARNSRRVGSDVGTAGIALGDSAVVSLRSGWKQHAAAWIGFCGVLVGAGAFVSTAHAAVFDRDHNPYNRDNRHSSSSAEVNRRPSYSAGGGYHGSSAPYSGSYHGSSAPFGGSYHGSSTPYGGSYHGSSYGSYSHHERVPDILSLPTRPRTNYHAAPVEISPTIVFGNDHYRRPYYEPYTYDRYPRHDGGVHVVINAGGDGCYPYIPPITCDPPVVFAPAPEPRVVYVPEPEPQVVYVPQPQVVYTPAPDPQVVYVPTAPPPSNPDVEEAPTPSDSPDDQGAEPSAGNPIQVPEPSPSVTPLPAAAEKAVVDIQEAWILADDSLLQRHLDAALGIRVYREGKFEQAVSSSDYLAATRKTLDTAMTQSFVLDSRTILPDGRVRAAGQHVYFGANNERFVTYVCYWLQPVGNGYMITAVNSASTPEQLSIQQDAR